MIKDLLTRMGAGAAAAILAAFAGGIVFVALAYGLFAWLETLIPVAGAAAVTALVFTVVTVVLVLVTPRLMAPGAPAATPPAPRLDPAAVRLATEAGVALLGILGDVALSRRLKREDKVLKTRRRKR